MPATHELHRIEDGETELVAWGTEAQMQADLIDLVENAVIVGDAGEGFIYQVVPAVFPEHHTH